jgi:ubiquinone/menaquinone biosynthesis C-methylase UbiE
MDWYNEQLLPRLLDKMMASKLFARERAKALQPVKGHVLEIGFGSGLNLDFYDPAAITQLSVVEPSQVAYRLAQKRIEQAPFPVNYIGLQGETIDLPDNSVDAVVSTWTLCTIPDAHRALSEIHRVLKKPEGRFFFLEHGQAPEPNIAKWQDRLTPIQKSLGGGCHLNRPIATLVREASFELVKLDNYYVKGPKVATYFYRGIACPSSS